MKDWVISKRLLGIAFIGAGVIGFVGTLGLDMLRGGLNDFGPTQQLAVGGAFGLVVIGVTLLPFGDRPA